ncbi:MAG: hypothetical protein ACKN9K_21955, partial [Dolichospermum sp.]
IFLAIVEQASCLLNLCKLNAVQLMPHDNFNLSPPKQKFFKFLTKDQKSVNNDDLWKLYPLI